MKERKISSDINKDIIGKDYDHSIFTEDYVRPISWDIVGQAMKNGLDASDPKQRMTAAHNLLGEISWTDTSDFMSDRAKRRTTDLCERMNVTKELMGTLLLTVGGRGGIGVDGGGSNNELTNWDGTKKRNEWGIG